MSFDFPASPTVGQVYSSGGISYRWDGQGWAGGPITDTGAFQPKDINLTAIAALADAAVGFPELDGVGGSVATPKVTIAEYRGGVATPRVLGNKTVWDAAAEVTITYAASWSPDMATFINAAMTLTGALAIGNPTNPVLGRSGAITLIAAADQALTFGSNWYFASKPTLVLTGESVLYYYVRSGKIHATFVGPVSNV